MEFKRKNRRPVKCTWKCLGKCKYYIDEQIPEIIDNFYPFISIPVSLMLYFLK